MGPGAPGMFGNKNVEYGIPLQDEGRLILDSDIQRVRFRVRYEGFEGQASGQGRRP